MSDTDQGAEAGNLGGQLSGGQGGQGGQQQDSAWQPGGRSLWSSMTDMFRPPQGQPRLPMFTPEQPLTAPSTDEQLYQPAQHRTDPNQWGRPDSILEGARAYPGITPGPFMPYGPVQIAQNFRASAAGLANMGSGMVSPFGAQSAAYQNAYLKALMQGQEWKARMAKYQMEMSAAKLEQQQELESQQYGEAFAVYDNADKKDPQGFTRDLERIAHDRQDARMLAVLHNGGIEQARALQTWRDHHYLNLAKTQQQIADTAKHEAEAKAAQQAETEMSDPNNQLPAMPSPGQPPAAPQAPEAPQGQPVQPAPPPPQSAQSPLGTGYNALQPGSISGAPQQGTQPAQPPPAQPPAQPQPPPQAPQVPRPPVMQAGMGGGGPAQPAGAPSQPSATGQPPAAPNAPAQPAAAPAAPPAPNQPAGPPGPQPFPYLPPIGHKIFGYEPWQIDQAARNYNKYGFDFISTTGLKGLEAARAELVNTRVRERAGQMNYVMDQLLQQLPAHGNPLVGINLISSIDPGLAAEVKAIDTYKVPMKDTGGLHGYWAKMHEIVTRIDPNFQETGYEVARKARLSLTNTSGPSAMGSRINAGNRMEFLLGQMLAITQQLQNTSSKPFNNIRNGIKAALGDSVLANWDSLHRDMAMEADQFFRNRSALGNVNRIQDQMNSSNNPATVQQYLGLLSSQVGTAYDTFADQYNKATHNDKSDPDYQSVATMLSPQTRPIYDFFRKNIPFPGGVPKSLDIVGPDGKTIKVPMTFDVQAPDLTGGGSGDSGGFTGRTATGPNNQRVRETTDGRWVPF